MCARKNEATTLKATVIINIAVIRSLTLAAVRAERGDESGWQRQGGRPTLRTEIGTWCIQQRHSVHWSISRGRRAADSHAEQAEWVPYHTPRNKRLISWVNA